MGCTYCFNGVAFPANVEGVIAVGAIDKNGDIWNYSSRGSEMDLVAPSGYINLDGDVRTIDRMGSNGYGDGNYINKFGGTSAACPQVSGVAALMLSSNPFLTETQVRTTLQQTATDMGVTGFDNTFGYGRVNAEDAVEDVYLYISGQDLVCTSNSTFVLHNRPSGTTVYWTKGYGLSYVSGQYTDNYTVKASSISSSSSWVKATITTDYDNAVVQKNIWAGTVLPLGLRIIDRRTGYPIYIFCLGEAHPVQAKHIDGEAFLDDWDWDVTNGYITYDNPYPYGDNSKATLRPLNYNFGVEIRAHNDCGWSEWADMDPYTIHCGYMMFTMHPNPTDDFVEITAYEDVNKTTLKSNDEYYEVQIYNTMKVLKYQVITKEPILRINTANFENGVYFVYFIVGKDHKVLQLVISH